MYNEGNATSAKHFLPLKKNHILFLEMQKEKGGGKGPAKVSKHTTPTLHTTQIGYTAVTYILLSTVNSFK